MSKRDSMLVMKFGGTSVTNPQSVEAINTLVQREIQRKPILVVSALSGITDLLDKLKLSIRFGLILSSVLIRANN